MKFLLILSAVVVVALVAGDDPMYKCVECHSEVLECFETSAETQKSYCVGENSACFEIFYFDKLSNKNMVERGCWPTIFNPTADPDLCKLCGDILNETGGHMITCNTCKTDECNNSNFNAN